MTASAFENICRTAYVAIRQYIFLPSTERTNNGMERVCECAQLFAYRITYIVRKHKLYAYILLAYTYGDDRVSSLALVYVAYDYDEDDEE